jgi:hypothetical protein
MYERTIIKGKLLVPNTSASLQTTLAAGAYLAG